MGYDKLLKEKFLAVAKMLGETEEISVLRYKWQVWLLLGAYFIYLFTIYHYF